MHPVVPWWAENAIVVALLTPAVWLVCRLLRSRPAAQHLLWLLLLVKLLLPPVFPAPLPVDRVATWPRDRAEVVAAAVVEPPNALPRSDVTMQSAPVGAASGDAAASGDVQTNVAVRAERPQPELNPIPARVVAAEQVAPDLTAAAPNVLSFHEAWHVVRPALTWIWLAGCAATGLLAFVRLRSAYRLLRRARLAPQELTESVAAAARRLRMRPVAARVLGSLASPLVVCLGRPRLIWPAERADAAALLRLAPVLAHELAHIRRRDHWVAWLELAGGLACWWNPTFWFIRRQLRETRELACDALALAETGDPRGYADLLLEMTTGQPFARLPAPMVGARSASRASLHRRLTMLFNERATARVSVLGGCAAAMLAAMLLPGWTVGQEPQNPPAGLQAELPNSTAGELPAAPGAGITPPLPKANDAPANPPIAADTSDSSAGTQPGTADPRQFPLLGPRVLPAADAAAQPPAGANAVELQGARTGVRVYRSEEGVHQEITLQDGRVVRINTGADGQMTVCVLRDGQLEEGFELQVPGLPAAAVVPTQPWGGADLLDSVGFTSGPPNVPANPSAVAADSSTSRELLEIECALAEVNLEEKQIEYELAATQPAPPDDSHAGRLKLLSLAVRKAELELARCRARLKAEERSDAQAFPPPNASSSGGQAALERLGIVFAEAVDDLGDGTPGRFARGLRVLAVREGGPAQHAGVRIRDVLVGLDRWEVASAEHVAFVLGNVSPESPLALYLLRDGEMLKGHFAAGVLDVRTATGAR